MGKRLVDGGSIDRSSGIAGLLRRLLRVTTSGRIIPEIDGLRFLAISSVVLFHIYDSWRVRSGIAYVNHPAVSLLNHFLSLGWMGVDLFFILSGFILGLPFARAYILKEDSAPPISRFYLRRLTRIEPPYAIAMLLFFVALLLSHRLPPKQLATRLFVSLLYQHNIVYHDGSILNTAAWSLEVEVQFYLLAPLFASVFKCRANLRRWIISAAVVGFALIASYLPRTFPKTLLSYLHYFLAGFLIADLYLQNLSVGNKTAFSDLTALGAVLVLTAASALSHTKVFLPVIEVAMLSLVVIGAFRGVVLNRFLTRIGVVVIGGMCYSIYLIHSHIVGAATTLLGSRFTTGYYLIDLSVLVLGLSAATLVASTCYFVLVERPCMDPKWPDKLLRYVSRALNRSRAAHPDAETRP